MAKKQKQIVLKMTEKEFGALVLVLDDSSSALGEIESTNSAIEKCDKMLLRNGYKRHYN